MRLDPLPKIPTVPCPLVFLCFFSGIGRCEEDSCVSLSHHRKVVRKLVLSVIDVKAQYQPCFEIMVYCRVEATTRNLRIRQKKVDKRNRLLFLFCFTRIQ